MNEQREEIEKVIQNAKIQEVTEQEKYCLRKTFLEISLATEQILQNIDNYKIDRETFRTVNITGEQATIELQKIVKVIKALERK